MEKSKYYYIIPSIIISVIVMFFIYSPQLTELREKVSAKESYINELKSSNEEQKTEINHLKEENKRIENELNELKTQEPSSENLEEVKIETSVPQDNITSEPTSTTISTPAKVEPVGKDYVLNKNTKKFHNPGCTSVSTLKASNRKDFTGSREEVINMGYSPCKKCNP